MQLKKNAFGVVPWGVLTYLINLRKTKYYSCDLHICAILIILYNCLSARRQTNLMIPSRPLTAKQPPNLLP